MGVPTCGAIALIRRSLGSSTAGSAKRAEQPAPGLCQPCTAAAAACAQLRISVAHGVLMKAQVLV